MTSKSNNSMTIAELEQLLDVYGADRVRWPAEARAAAANLVASDAGARRLLAETAALDHVLERAPVPGLAVEAAVAERIVAAAQRSPRVVPLSGAHRLAEAASPGDAALLLASTAGPSRRRQQSLSSSRWRPRLLSREMGAAGLLAASLAMGVVIGNSTLPPQLLPALADMAGLGPSRDSLVKIAMFEEDAQ